MGGGLRADRGKGVAVAVAFAVTLNIKCCDYGGGLGYFTGISVAMQKRVYSAATDAEVKASRLILLSL
jgi:hypothetical protein